MISVYLVLGTMLGFSVVFLVTVVSLIRVSSWASEREQNRRPRP